MKTSSYLPKKTCFRLPRVLADYGGRRKIFDRRIDFSRPNLLERRFLADRRSGFDRRSSNTPPKSPHEKRKNFSHYSTLKDH